MLTSSAFEDCDTDIKNCCELQRAVALVIHTSMSLPEEGNELRYNRGSYQVLISVVVHSYRPGVMTTESFSSTADGNAFLRKQNLKFIIQPVFQNSFSIQNFMLIFVILWKNNKDAAIS